MKVFNFFKAVYRYILVTLGLIALVLGIAANWHALFPLEHSESTATITRNDANSAAAPIVSEKPKKTADLARSNYLDPLSADSSSNVLIQNDDGEVAIWGSKGTYAIGNGNMSIGNPGPSWHAVGSGDFSGAAHSHILWQNENGQVAIWETIGPAVISANSLGNPGPDWHLVGTGNYNCDGRYEIRFQSSKGEVGIWKLQGTAVMGSADLGNPGPSWHAIGSGSFKPSP